MEGVPMWRFYWRWVWRVFNIKSTFGVADGVAGAISIVGPAVVFFWPDPDSASAKEIMDNLLWQIPLGTLGLLFLARVILAPYWLYRESQREIQMLQAKIEEQANLSIDTPTLHFHNLSMHQISPPALSEGMSQAIRPAQVSGVWEGTGAPVIERIGVIMGGEQLDALNWHPQGPMVGGATSLNFVVRLPDWVGSGEYTAQVIAFLKGGRPKHSSRVLKNSLAKSRA
jgi:hypothetical protein